MKKIITLLLIVLMPSFLMLASEGGNLTSTPSPIVPNQSLVINYDGTATNFANWQPRCFIHTWLVPKTGQTFTGSYAPAWVTCNSEAEYNALDAKWKMTYSNAPGKYSITIPNLFTFFAVLDVDKAKVGQIGIVVRAQFSGNNNQTIDFLLPVTDAVTTDIQQLESNVIISSQSCLISAKFAGTAKVELFTTTGQLLKKVTAENEFSQTLKSGVYFLRINDETYKVMVQ